MLNSITLNFTATTGTNMMTAEITACEDSHGPYIEVDVEHPSENGDSHYVAGKVCFSPAEVVRCFCDDMGWDDAHKTAVRKILHEALDLYGSFKV